eukprot:tig00020537_g10279.t1
MDACEDRAGKRARFASAVGIVSRIEPRLDTLPDELLLKILRAIGLRDVLVCRPHQVCRKLRGFLRATVWDELDLAPSEEEIWAAEALDGRAAFNANHMRRLKRALASLHPEAGFAAWGSARALRLRLSSVHLAWASSSCMNVEHPEMEEAYTTVALVSGLAHASPAIGSVRVEFRGPTREEAADMAEHPTIFHLGHPQDAEWPRIATLLAALGAMPSLTRLELGRDVAEPGGFFAWSELIANEGGVLPLALAPFAALEHLSLPFPLAAARLRALFDALPALRSLGAAVPLDHLRRATPLLVGNPRLERVELAIVYSVRGHGFACMRAPSQAPAGALSTAARAPAPQGAVIDEAEESEPISPAEALEALAGPSRAARVRAPASESPARSRFN